MVTGSYLLMESFCPTKSSEEWSGCIIELQGPPIARWNSAGRSCGSVHLSTVYYKFPSPDLYSPIILAIYGMTKPEPVPLKTPSLHCGGFVEIQTCWSNLSGMSPPPLVISQIRRWQELPLGKGKGSRDSYNLQQSVKLENLDTFDLTPNFPAPDAELLPWPTPHRVTSFLSSAGFRAFASHRDSTAEVSICILNPVFHCISSSLKQVLADVLYVWCVWLPP